MSDSIKRKSIALALLVTFLWATSWVMVKLGLDDLPPITFAGLRYFLAFLILLPFATRIQKRKEIKSLSGSEWRSLVLLGLVYYTINQGAIFAALALLPAMAVSLILTFTSMVTAGIAIRTLGEKATWLQWVGILLNLTGAFLYFYPIDLPKHQWLGILLAFIGMLANSVSTVIGRKVNRSGKVHNYFHGNRFDYFVGSGFVDRKVSHINCKRFAASGCAGNCQHRTCFYTME
jgi:drug/metabolite transporter (DMT)-like permease